MVGFLVISASRPLFFGPKDALQIDFEQPMYQGNNPPVMSEPFCSEALQKAISHIPQWQIISTACCPCVPDRSALSQARIPSGSTRSSAKPTSAMIQHDNHLWKLSWAELGVESAPRGLPEWYGRENSLRLMERAL